MNVSIKTALISTFYKNGLDALGEALAGCKTKIYSTGGTLRHLSTCGVPCTSITELTRFPEILDGRVKTLNPAIFAGMLARRDKEDHLKTLAEWGFPPFDLVVVNLYPFESALAEGGKSLSQMVEMIDIGGVALIRAAAKNFPYVAVCTNPEDYAGIIDELKSNDGALSLATRLKLAQKAFEVTNRYDAAIAGYLAKATEKDLEGSFAPAVEMPVEQSNEFASVQTITYKKIQDLRYGENAHQKAAFYAEWTPRDAAEVDKGLTDTKQLQGKALSYNNIMDADTALEVVREFEEPCCVVLKHSNPCGLATGDDVITAYERARATDPTSSFGGIIGVNREITAPLAEQIAQTFNEVVIAPSYSDDALEIFKKKKNLRLLEVDEFCAKRPALQPRAVVGGILLQDRDIDIWDNDALKVVTAKQPADEDWKGLAFAWKCVKWVKSNAIVITSATETIGIGAGQMSRVDSTTFAIHKAQKSVEGGYLGSDAFFPFADSIETAAEAGIRAIIQPGGSIRDQEVIDAADKAGIIMVFTGMRHFRH